MGRKGKEKAEQFEDFEDSSSGAVEQLTPEEEAAFRFNWSAAGMAAWMERNRHRIVDDGGLFTRSESSAPVSPPRTDKKA